MKRILAVVLSLMLLAGVISCAALAEGEKIIHYSIDGDPQQMDPTLNSYSRSSIVLQSLFTGLYKLGADGKTYIPSCAESYEVSEDGMSYTFHLRQDLLWSDGTPLTANDFAYSWKRVLDPEVASGAVSDMWVLKNGKAYNNGECSVDEVGVQAIDDYTLYVETEDYTPWFVTLTSTTSFMPVKQEVVEAEEPWTKDVSTYISNGPFRLAEYKSLDKLVYEKNPYYYDQDKVQIDGLIYYIIEDATSCLVSYNNGDLDVNDSLDSNARDQYGSTDEYYSIDRIGIQYWDFNCRLEEFSDKRVRQAFAMSIDRAAVLQACLLYAEQPVYGFVPTSQPSLTQDGVSYREIAGDLFTEDVAAAQALLAEAGYANGEGFPVVRIVHQNDPTQKLMANLLGEMWKANLGVEYELVSYDSSTYWGELDNGNFSVARNGFVCDYLDPSANLKIWVTGSNARENGWDDPVYDEMILSASAVTDPAEREAALIEAETYLVDEMPGMPFYTQVDDYLVKPELKGIIKNVIGHPYFEYAYFE